MQEIFLVILSEIMAGCHKESCIRHFSTYRWKAGKYIPLDAENEEIKKMQPQDNFPDYNIVLMSGEEILFESTPMSFL